MGYDFYLFHSKYLLELCIRDSDSPSLISRMKCKARKTCSVSREIRKINFVIFVVNGLSVLKSMDNDEGADTQYTQLIASTFNCPYFSFGGIWLCLSFFHMYFLCI